MGNLKHSIFQTEVEFNAPIRRGHISGLDYRESSHHKEIQQILGTLGLFTSTHGLEGSKQVERTQTTQSGDLRQTQSKCLITSTKPKYSQEMFKAVTG